MASDMSENSKASRAPRAALHTLGCRLNQSESAAIRRSLEQAGYKIVPWGEEAEVCVLNSCTVTAQSDAKSRQALRAVRRRHPAAKLALVGCYAQTEGEHLAELGIADLIVGNREKMRVADLLDHVAVADKPLVVRPPMTREPFTLDVFAAVDGKTRASLKIQDGCDFMCTFCIIPTARGRARARTLPNLVAEAEQLASAGVKEIVLTGVNLGTYQDGARSLVDVVDRLNDISGLERIRISSIEPTTVGEGLLERMADKQHRLTPFLHLPLQSGSTRVLSAMRRRYTAREYRKFAERALGPLLTSVPRLCLGTDVMVGFPGEDDKAFQETVDLLASLPFAYFHVFPFSERAGTSAVHMAGSRTEDKVPPEVRQRRGAVLHALSAEKQMAFQAHHQGSVATVLFERDRGDGLARGLTENYLRVEVATGDADALHNRLMRVRLLFPGSVAMRGELCAHPHAGRAGEPQRPHTAPQAS